MKPYWPNLKVPEDGPTKMPAGSSGSLKFDTSNVSSTTIETVVGAGKLLCSIDSLEPTPFVLTVSPQLNSGALPGMQGTTSVELIAGQNGGACSANIANGFIEVQYGAGGTTQRLVMDMRPGTYQLPPCNQVRVFARAWFNVGLGAYTPDLTVYGALAPGLAPRASDPTNTMYFDIGAATEFDFKVPDKARTVDCWAFCVALGAGKPVLSLYSSQITGFPSLVRDYSTGIWAPPYPAQCIVGTSDLQATLISTVAVDAWVQFMLEF